MTLYIYNFADGVNIDPKVCFNGNLYHPDAKTWRLKLTSRYTNKLLDDANPTAARHWVIELELDTYNDRYTQFNIPDPDQSRVSIQFASGYYDYTLEWTDQIVDTGFNPDVYTWNAVIDGILKLKTSATERLDFEGPEKDYFPTNHYEGENSDAQSYVIYKD